MSTAADNKHQAQHHGSLKSYLIGFGLSVVLTAIPFYLVMGNVFDSAIVTALTVFALGGIQMMVHIFYFLHVTTKVEEGWLALSMIFTVVLVVIVMTGSIWVMFHLHENMTPAHDTIERVLSTP